MGRAKNINPFKGLDECSLRVLAREQWHKTLGKMFDNLISTFRILDQIRKR